MSKDTPPSEQASAFLKQLAASSKTLNSASDELGASISALDKVLHKLNLGIKSWVFVSGYDDDNGPYDVKHLGYAKVGHAWGIALRTMTGHNHYVDETHREESWLFNDAPRWLRIEALPKLPELFTQLLKDVDAATQRVKEMSSFANDFAAHMSATAQELGLFPAETKTEGKKATGGVR
jgi:hypothetical protein